MDKELQQIIDLPFGTRRFEFLSESQCKAALVIGEKDGGRFIASSMDASIEGPLSHLRIHSNRFDDENENLHRITIMDRESRIAGSVHISEQAFDFLNEHLPQYCALDIE